MPLSKINSFLKNFTKETPYLVIDLSLVTNFYKKLKKKFPNTLIYYAVKANPAPEIIKCLKKEGSYFDVSSKKEIQLKLCSAWSFTTLRNWAGSSNARLIFLG